MLLRLIKHLSAQFGAHLNRMVRPTGLNEVGFRTLMMLYANTAAGVFASQLSEAAGETRANMTRICDELVAKGWMRRVPNPEDRRRVDLSLTDSGMKLLGEIAPMARQNAEAFFKRVFSAQERATLQDLLRRFSDALSEG